MKIMDKMMWMGVGVGAGILYKKYEEDICSFFNKQRNKMMKEASGIRNKNSSK